MFVLSRWVLLSSRSIFWTFLPKTHIKPNQPKLMARSDVLKACVSAARPILNRAFSSKPNDSGSRRGSFAMDVYVKNLQTKSSKKPKVKEWAAHKPPEAVVSGRRPLPRAFQENAKSDIAIRNLLTARVSPIEIAEALHKFALEDKVPSRKTLVMVAGACASKGYLEGIQTVSDACELAYPAEAAWQMYYRHYEAEAHWKCGDYEKSLQIFQDLFEGNTLQRRKIVNLSNFLIRHVVNSKLVEFYPKLVAFAEFCMKSDEVVPMSNLWKTAFCSDSYEANCLAGELLAKHHEGLLPHIERKVPAILEEAKSLMQVDILQRLMQFVLSYELKEHYPAVFGAYMEVVCDANDADRASETFDFISKSSIIIPAESMKKYLALIAFQKRKAPDRVLPPSDLKVNDITKPLSNDFKF